MQKTLPIALSNRHIHLCQEDIEILFGKDYELKKRNDLSQPGQYAAEEKVDLIGPKNTIKGVRVLGPTRAATQVEVSISDSFQLGVEPFIRNSGDIKGTAGITIQGPQGQVELEEGLIVAARHIHMHPSEAEEFGLKEGDIVEVRTSGDRSLTFNNVLIRSGEGHKLEMHVDIEEGNAAGVKNGDPVEIIK